MEAPGCACDPEDEGPDCEPLPDVPEDEEPDCEPVPDVPEDEEPDVEELEEDVPEDGVPDEPGFPEEEAVFLEVRDRTMETVLARVLSPVDAFATSLYLYFFPFTFAFLSI